MKSLNVCIPVSPSLFWPNSKISFIKSKSWSVFAWWSSLEIEFERQMGSIVKIQVPRKLWGKERSRRSDLCRGIGFRCGDMFLHLPLLKATQTRESGIHTHQSLPHTLMKMKICCGKIWVFEWLKKRPVLREIVSTGREMDASICQIWVHCGSTFPKTYS